jgi:hypothetical protein
VNYADFAAGVSDDFMERGTEASNMSFSPTLKLAVVAEVLNDPGALTQERLEILEDQCVNSGYISTAPHNSILVRTIHAGAGKKSPDLFFCYPLFPPYLCMPVKPGETVWLIDPMPAQESDVVYWMCRAITPDYVDDINFTHADRSIMETGVKSEAEEPPKNPGFPNGDPKSQSKYTLTPPHAYEMFYTGSYGNQLINFERVPRFTKRPADLVLQGSNNTLICLGEDRGYTAEFRPSTDRTFPADEKPNVSNANKNTAGEFPPGNWKEDDSDLGDPTAPPEPFKVRKKDFKVKDPAFRGTIDLVAGRGQSDEGTAPLEIENTWKWKETNKNPVNFGDAAGADKDPVGNKFVNPAEGDPDFVSDLSRVYISMKTSGDKNFGLSYANADATPVDDAPYVIVKSDEARIVVREAGSIRFVKEGESKCEFSMLSNGNIAMDANKIYLGENTGGVESQPVVRGALFVTAIKNFATDLSAAQAAVAPVPSAFKDGMPLPASAGNFGAPVLIPGLKIACDNFADAVNDALSSTTYTK